MGGQSGTYTAQRIKRLRKTVDDYKSKGAMSDSEAESLQDHVGSLVERCLEKTDHPIQDHVKALLDWIRSLQVASSGGNTKKSSKSRQKRLPKNTLIDSKQLFWLLRPAPYIGNRAIRCHWRIQLLLLMAVGSEHSSALQQMLQTHASRLSDAADKAYASSVKDWSVGQFLHNIDIALNVLDYPEGTSSLELTEDRMLRVGGEEVRLSVTEHRLLKLLYDQKDQQVSFDELRDAGVANPSRIMSGLRKKLLAANIDLNIITGTCSYLLSTMKI